MSGNGDETRDQVAASNQKLREAGVLPPVVDSAGDGVEAERPSTAPEIALPGVGRQTQSSFARQLGAVMAATGEVYMRDDVPMALNRRRNKLEVLTPDLLVTFAERHAVIHVWGKRISDDAPLPVVPRSMKKEVAGLTLRSFEFKDQQKQIRRVNPVPMPALRRDGSVALLAPGFDDESGVLTMPSTLHYADMPVDEAVRWLVNFHAGFPLADRDGKSGLSRSLAVHVAAMLSVFGLGLLSPKALVPMFVYTANTQGSGKSLLCKIPLTSLYGAAGSLVFGKDEEELRKQLDMSALEGASYVFFDNVKRKLSSQLIDMYLTQSVWKGRVMGGQRGFEVEKQGVMFVSVNHVEVDKDADRRALYCELFQESSEKRRFEAGVIDETFLSRPEVRQDVLTALWSLVRHWVAKGRPRAPGEIASYEEWSRVIGGIVYAAGLGDPMEKVELEFGDTETRDMEALIRELAGMIALGEGDNPVKYDAEFDEIVRICDEKELFSQVLDGKKNSAGVFEITKSSRIRMGKLLKKESGRTWVVPEVGKVRFSRRGSKNARVFPVERC